MYYKTTALVICSLLALSGCGDTKNEKNEEAHTQKTQEVKPAVKAEPKESKKVIVKKDYTIEEIFNSMCVECHSPDGSGNTEKLTPSMAGESKEEIKAYLLDIEKDKGHIVMQHNRGEILKMGMKYSAEDMAEYMSKKFATKK
jgi:cytochrome c553